MCVRFSREKKRLYWVCIYLSDACVRLGARHVSIVDRIIKECKYLLQSREEKTEVTSNRKE